MEWRLCEDRRFSECDLVAAAEMGRNFGGARDDKVVDEQAKIKNLNLKLGLSPPDNDI